MRGGATADGDIPRVAVDEHMVAAGSRAIDFQVSQVGDAERVAGAMVPSSPYALQLLEQLARRFPDLEFGHARVHLSRSCGTGR